MGFSFLVLLMHLNIFFKSSESYLRISQSDQLFETNACIMCEASYYGNSVKTRKSGKSVIIGWRKHFSYVLFMICAIRSNGSFQAQI